MKLVMKIPEFISHKNVIKLIIDCHGSRSTDTEKYIRNDSIHIHNVLTDSLA